MWLTFCTIRIWKCNYIILHYIGGSSTKYIGFILEQFLHVCGTVSENLLLLVLICIIIEMLYSLHVLKFRAPNFGCYCRTALCHTDSKVISPRHTYVHTFNLYVNRFHILFTVSAGGRTAYQDQEQDELSTHETVPWTHSKRQLS